jgi:multidrug efflux pump
MPHFFIDRPIFATVLSIVVVIVGGIALLGLPVGQYPEVTPPTISIQTVYPGASAQVVADTVTTPIEQEVNGVENMLFMNSRSTSDGVSAIDVTFRLGTDIDQAQVLTQNRVAVALAKLPEEVKRQGVTTKKKSPSILLCVNLFSPEGRYDQLYLSNYALIQIRDALARIDGVGDVAFLGARDYAMRIWLDPHRLAARKLSAGDVVRALREQNVQVAAGRLGQPPAPAGTELTVSLSTQGRLLEPAEFEEVIIKTGRETPPAAADPPGFDSGGVVRIRDVGRVELGAKNEDTSSTLDGQDTITIAVFQLPGSNALATAERVRARMADLARDFPPGLDYAVLYDTTVFVEESIHEVVKTLFEAVVLVFVVVLIFLQNWRATLIPMVAVPVSLIGTFAIMQLLGFSLNNLSLFGLVLAIGIVVDDAIVVVENVERLRSEGLSARDAARQAMTEVTGPVIAIALVLSAVFVPTAFIAGISGEFYRQFAITIAASTVISACNSLTLSPALAALLFRGGHGAAPATATPLKHRGEPLPRPGIALMGGLASLWLAEDRAVVWAGLAEAEPVGSFGLWSVRLLLFAAGASGAWLAAPACNALLAVAFRLFNVFFDLTTGGYSRIVGLLLRLAIVVMGLYVGLMAATYYGFTTVPVGFIPEQDKGYLVVNASLPEAASLARTEAVIDRLTREALATPGVAHVIAVSGYSFLSGVTLSSAGGMYVILDPFPARIVDPDRSAAALIATLRRKFAAVREARVVVFGAPPIEGLGSTGGFKLQLRDRTGRGPAALEGAAADLAEALAAQPGLTGLYSGFSADQPELFIDVDRTKAKAQGVAVAEINQTLQVYLGSAYVNDFTAFGRNWPVTVQADAPYRMRATDIGRLEVRNAAGEMVPLATLLAVHDTSGPPIVYHYNLYPSADLAGSTLPGTSSGDAIGLVETLAGLPPFGRGLLPPGIDFEWTDLSLQQILAGDTASFVFVLGTVFVFLVLAAQYESWSLPLAIILIVPMCLLAAIAGVWLVGSDNNIFTQIGLVVLVGLAAKNAILIVEFARQREEQGLPRTEAVLQAAVQRLRPILMTSLAFILGVVPLVLGKGAGAEMRNALGTAVFSGMLGVTVFGVLFTPVFYAVVMSWSGPRSLTEGKPGP